MVECHTRSVTSGTHTCTYKQKIANIAITNEHLGILTKTDIITVENSLGQYASKYLHPSILRYTFILYALSFPILSTKYSSDTALL